MKTAVNSSDLFVAYEKNLKLFKDSVVKAGIPASVGSKSHDNGQTILEVGLVHEFGSPERNIPKRSFIREPIIKHQKDLIKLIENNHKKVSENSMSVQTALDRVGKEAMGIIKGSFRDNDWKANSKATVKAKGSDTPLIDEGRLVGSITYIIEKEV